MSARTTTPCQWAQGCREGKNGGPAPATHQKHCHAHYSKLRATERIRAGLTDSTQVRERIQRHLDTGRTIHALAQVSGVDHEALAAIHTGRTTLVRVGTADRIMAAPFRATAVGIDRRVKALQRIGWTLDLIGAELGISGESLALLLRRGGHSERTAQRISEVYDALSGTPGPSRRVALRSAKRGHPSPLAWEGRDIDDSDTTPDDGIPRRHTPGSTCVICRDELTRERIKQKALTCGRDACRRELAAQRCRRQQEKQRAATAARGAGATRNRRADTSRTGAAA